MSGGFHKHPNITDYTFHVVSVFTIVIYFLSLD